MPENLEFRILGPLEAYANGLPLRLGTPRQRALLAYLLLNRNQIVSIETLIDALWGERPPGTAAKMVHNLVWQLRKALAEVNAEGVLTTRGRGYLLSIAPEQLDAVRFERLVEQARAARAGGDEEAGATKLREALALWQGSALPEFAYQSFAEAEIARLEELHLAALEERIEADLALGRQADIVGELEALIVRHPLRERLRAQLMLALYRSGRQAEALVVYQQTRKLLSEELGIEPGRPLQELERAILLQDPRLDLAPAPAREPTPEPEAKPQPAAPAAAREVRKLVTALVAAVDPADLRPDPEARRRPLADALGAIARVVERHGGHLDQLTGGTAVAVFGVPTAHEDDALRAVRAAMELRETIAAEAAEPIRVRIGIESAEVVAEGLAIVAGDVVELAYRLERLASPGEILIGEATERLVRGAVRAEAIDASGTWRVLESLVGALLPPRRRDAPLVGRERELGQLRDALGRADREQTSYLFTLLGPPGIGKSRLAEEFASSLDGEAAVLAGRCLSYGEGITFWPLAEVVRQAAGAETRAAIGELLAGTSDADLVADRLAAALGLTEGAGAREEIFWAARKLFETLARERPLVLVFDDLHWAEPTLLDLLEHAAEWIRGAPVFLLCLARPELLESRPAWSGGKLNATTILLEPLSADESERLIDALAGAELPVEARARITETAEGNPLFLEQLLLMLGDRPLGRELAVPTTIQALLGARVERLEPDTRLVLERASVIGKHFAREALSAVSPPDLEEELQAHLDSLVRRELIRPARSEQADDAYLFRHQLIRDVTYDSVPKEVRAGLHEELAEWLERTEPQREREYGEIVGYHLEQAHRYLAELGPVDEHGRRLAERAAERLATAGRRAYARGDVPAAASLFSRAVELLEPPAAERLELLTDLGDALREIGDFKRAEAVLNEAISAASASGHRTLEMYARVISLRLRSQFDPDVRTEHLLREADRAIAVFEEVGDEQRLARAWELRAWALWVSCRAKAAEEALQQAIEYARRAEDARTEAQSMNLLLGAAFFGPTPVSEAVQLCREVLARPGERRRVAASALRALAGLRAMEGAFDEARDVLALSQEIFEDLGLTVTAATAEETAAIIELLAGDPVAAERHLRRGYASLERIGETSSLLMLTGLLAQSLAAQGRYDEALPLTELSERTAAADDLGAQVHWRAVRAKVLARLGRDDEAEKLALEAVALAEQTDFVIVCGDALMDLAEVLSLLDRRDAAASAAERALRLYESKGSVVSAERARALVTAELNPPKG